MLKRIKNFLEFKYILFRRNYSYNQQIRNCPEFIIKNIQGSKMKLSTSDKGLSYDLICDNIREPQSTKRIKQIIDSNDVVIDIGANIGYYTLLMKKAKKIHAVEPVRENYERLRENVKLNRLTNVRLYNVAIGDKTGVDFINISEKSNWHTLRSINKNFVRKERVTIRRLDDFIRINNITPSFIRMDVEGYEYHILRGMPEILSKHFPLKIFIEIHPHIMEKQETIFILNELKNSGFEISKMFRCYNLPEMKFKDDIEWSYKIGDWLKDGDALSGRYGAFEVFFERK